MGAISLFNALGRLGSDWGEAREEAAQDAFRKQQMQLATERQNLALQQGQQRLQSEQARLDIERQREAREAKAQQATEEWRKMQGDLNAFVYWTGGEEGKGEKVARNSFDGTIRPARPGEMTFLEKYKFEHPPKKELRTVDVGGKGEYEWFQEPDREGAPPTVTPTGKFAMPPASVLGQQGQPSPAQTASDAADMVMNGMAFQLATSNLGKGGKSLVMHELLRRGYIAPSEPTNTNRDAISAITALMPNLKTLEQRLSEPDPNTGRPLYENNSVLDVGKQAWQWFQYKHGKAPSDPLLQAIIPFAAFVDVQATAPWARAGRSMRVFMFIQQHVPNPDRDTPQNMWIKLQQMKVGLGPMLNNLRFITNGGIRRPDGKIQPIGEFNPYSLQGQGIGPAPGAGGGNFNPDPGTLFPDATINPDNPPNPPQ